MKYFIYTYAEKRVGAHTEKTVRVYQIKKNLPVFMGGMTETFMSEFQLVMSCMELYKLLPAACFERTQFGGYKYAYASELREAGIASITRVR